jgi:ELWxxDGT repeat protein
MRVLATIAAVAVAMFLSLPVAAADAGRATLVSDIRTDGGSDPRQLTRAGGLVYLTAIDGTHGRELWVTDGSTDGTRMVKDIRPGSAGSAPQALTRVGSRLFFTANDGVHGRELWVSDGTAAGTSLVKDLTAGPRGQVDYSITPLGDVALFSPSHRDLYRTDGTTKGTRLVRSFLAVNLDDTAKKGKALVFPAYDAVWKTDGTNAGTRRISPLGVQAHDLTSFRGRVWFTHIGYPEVPQLWRSDGTKAGLEVVPGVYAPMDLTVMGDTLYLNASASASKAPRLFGSDGSVSGTSPVRPRVRPLVGMVKEAGHLWMARMSEPRPLPDELWVSDGTATGTTLVMGGAGDWVIGDEVVAGLAFDGVGTDGSIWFSAGPATEVGDEFVMTDTELWRSDGTTAGTVEAVDIDPDGSSMPRGFVKLGDAILFSATDGAHGRELWRFDP